MRERKESGHYRIESTHALHSGEMKPGIARSSGEARGPHSVMRSCVFHDHLKSVLGRNGANSSVLLSALNMYRQSTATGAPLRKRRASAGRCLSTA